MSVKQRYITNSYYGLLSRKRQRAQKHKGMLLLILSAGLAGLAAGQSVTQPNIGRCRNIVPPNLNFNFNQLLTDNNGIGKYVYVADAAIFSNVQYLYVARGPTSLPGVHNYTIYSKNFGQLPTILHQGQYYNAGQGIVIAIDTKDGRYVVYKKYIIEYVPGRYYFYYICSDNGADTTDNRVVVQMGIAANKLTSQELTHIRNKDRSFGFVGNLKHLP